MNNAPISLGETIAFARMSLGLRRAELSKKIGVTPVAIWYWETGKCRPSSHIVPRLAQVLGLPLEDLLEGVKSPTLHSGIHIFLQNTAQYLAESDIALTPVQALSLFETIKVHIRTFENSQDPIAP